MAGVNAPVPADGQGADVNRGAGGPGHQPRGGEPAGDYDASAAAWAAGPERVYRRLAEALVDRCAPLAGARVLDVGAGTGAVSEAVRAAGAVVTATDVAAGMLAHDRHARPPAAASDARRLAFRAGAFDVVLLGFVVNHLLDPARALAEAARVVRTGGLVAASTFHADWDHPAKHQVDAVAERYGYRRPAWHRDLKGPATALTGYPDALTDVARAAGLAGTRVDELLVDTGVETPAEIAAWRLGMAHLAPFLAALSPADRRRLTDAAAAAVGPHPVPVRPRVLIVTGRAVVGQVSQPVRNGSAGRGVL